MFSIKSKYFLCVILELIMLVIFCISAFIAFGFEIVVLNPWTFMVPLGLIFITINSFLLLFIFGE